MNNRIIRIYKLFFISATGTNREQEFQLRTDSRLCQFISNNELYPEYNELFYKNNGRACSYGCEEHEKCKIITQYGDRQQELLADFFDKILNIQYAIYNPGFYKLGLYCVPKGHIFKITDYDGDEHIDHFDPLKPSSKWFTA